MLPLEQAPDLRGATAWRNVDRAVDLRHDLAGQVVVLLFFTPSCVHCREALLALALLHARFLSRPVAVLGVATPRDLADARIDDVLAELDVRFPVALDRDAAVWSAYGCAAWPTLVLIDGTGRVRFHGCGEPEAAALGGAIKTLLAEVEYGGEAHMLPAVPRVPPPAVTRSLAQPAGLALDAAHGVLWIADAGRHRVLAVDAATGALRAVAGGMAGAGDGERAVATFFAPRGLWFDPADRRLLIADAGNHLVRVLADDGAVTTLLGTGVRSHDRGGGARGVGQGLALPWGIAGQEGGLLIAMAGAHQLWSMAWADGAAQVAAGSGVRGRDDGAAQVARLAQPRGVAVRGDQVAFVDADNHAVRVWDRAANRVDTLVGVDGKAGDAEGVLAEARLQQPSALVWHGDAVVVADTGNGKLKRIDRARGQVTTLVVGVPLERPAALALDGDRLFVADGARGAVLVVDLVSGAAHELEIAVPAPPIPAGSVRVRAYADCVLKIPLALPAGASVHPDVPVRVALSCVVGAPLAVDLTYDAEVEGGNAVVRGVKTGMMCEGRLRAELHYYTRHGEGRVCHAQHVMYEAKITLEPDAPAMALWALGS